MGRFLQVVSAVVLSAGAIWAGGPRGEAVLPGVVVESVDPACEAAKAGLAAGDLLVAWSTPAPDSRGGPFLTYAHWLEFVSEQAPRGTVALSGSRGGTPLSLTIAPGKWPVTAAPRLSPKWESAAADGQRLVASGEVEQGTAVWEALAGRLSERGATAEASWFIRRSAEAWLAKGEKGRAWDTLSGGAARLEKEAAWRASASLWDWAGAAWERAKERERAREACGLGLADWNRVGPCLGLARELGSLGVLDKAEDPETALTLFRRALELYPGLGAGSLDEFSTLMELGTLEIDRGELDSAQAHFDRALAVREALSPGSLDAARCLNNLGLVAYYRGDLSTAESFHRWALATKERMAPETLTVATSLNNLGMVSSERGDLEASEAFHRRALALREALAPDSLEVAKSLNNLGNVALLRSDFEVAQDFFVKALAIKRKRVPGTLDEASTLLNLGGLAMKRADFDRAREFYRGYQVIMERLYPESQYVADVHIDLGIAAFEEQDWATAESETRAGLTLYQRVSPGCLNAAEGLKSLAKIRLARGAADEGLSLLAEAEAVYEKIAPTSEGMADCQNLLALQCAAAGEADAADGHFRRSLETVESLGARLGGGTESKSEFAAGTTALYGDYVDFLVAAGRPREAFDVLERSRARVLLRMLAERDLVFSGDIPPEMDRRRRTLAAEYDRAQSQLAALSPDTDAAAVEASRAELARLRAERESFKAELVKASPRLAALEYPEPLGCAGTLEALEPGTLLLSYSVRPEKTLLFALGPGPGEFHLYATSVSAGRLAQEMRRLRRLIADGAEPRAASRALSRLLLEQARDPMRRCRRVVVVADGPLHFLPFAALAWPGGGKTFTYLAQERPAVLAPSATLYAESRTRSPRAPGPVLAFGDPDLTGSGAARSLQGLVPLPGTRAELAAIQAIFGSRAQVFLGAEASEGRARAAGTEPSILHFACHGLLEAGRPLDAGLALAPGAEGQNGLLQAWEIFEGLRLDADLVTLSACETGVGKVQGGEGLLGLSRAFQYAGARSLLVSLWRVEDASTAALMARFYRHLAAGEPKDESLRAAQRELLRGDEGPAAALPSRWAAFQLVGDWR